MLLDVDLIRLKKNKGEDQVKCECRSGQKDKDINRRASSIGGTGEPVQNESNKRVEGKKVRSQCYNEIRFSDDDTTPSTACMDRLHRAAEEQGEYCMREFVTDNIGEDRLFKKEVGDQIGQTASKEVIGGINFIPDSADGCRELPSESKAERDESYSKEYFCDFINHGVLFQ